MEYVSKAGPMFAPYNIANPIFVHETVRSC